MFAKKDWKDQVNWTQIVIAIIIGLAILGYGGLNYKAKQADLKLKTNTLLIEAQAQKVKEEKYRACIVQAERDQNSWWENSCKVRKLGTNCSLPSDQADDINRALKEDKDRCVQLYK